MKEYENSHYTTTCHRKRELRIETIVRQLLTMHVTRIILITSVTIFLCINPFLKTAHSLNGADIALYNDSIAPSEQSGVWQDGITAIKNMLTTEGFTYEEITYKDLNPNS